MLQFLKRTAAIVQWQNTGLWHRVSWVRSPLAAPIGQHHRVDLRPSRIPVAAHVKHADKAGGIYIGCSGWAYPSWKPGFYPSTLSSKKFLEYYATRLNSVEVNYTFRSLPSESTIKTWLDTAGHAFPF